MFLHKEPSHDQPLAADETSGKRPADNDESEVSFFVPNYLSGSQQCDNVE
jgi:hypothetical protein